MAYGDYDGPNKPNKGVEGGACNRGRRAGIAPTAPMTLVKTLSTCVIGS